MPKKLQKTPEETSVENFSPKIIPGDIKITTEKKVKERIPQEEFPKTTTEKLVKTTPAEIITQGSIEKPYKKPKKITLEKEIPKKTKNGFKKNYFQKEINFKPQKIELKKDGYELIITEKPQAANKIATALGKATQKYNNKIPYYEVLRDGKKILVACAVGHLFTLKQNSGNGSTFPVFDIAWVPNYLTGKSDYTKKYYDTISMLAKGAGSITVATDFDIEGEVIGLNVVRYICGQKDAQRMKFSTLTTNELNNAYENKLKTLEWNQAIAGESRHYLDWFYGINLSRALMNAIKSTGKFKIMSIGRVQGPTLNMIVEREREILKFKPEPYWQIFITVEDKKNKLELKHTKDIFNKNELENFKDLKDKEINIETKKTQQILPPNPPFNLTNLQTESYRLYGITPSKTLQIAQSLYLAGLISYPRTSSQKLPASIGYKEILEKIAKKFKVEKLIKKQKPTEGEKTDPAHPSIYPTGNDPEGISSDEEKIYNLIAKRFLALFCEDAIIDRKTVKTEIDKLAFSTTGSVIAKKAWLEIYPTKIKEENIPDMNGKVKIIDSRIEQKETQPQRRYSPASIITELEKRNLGTKATRSSIVETLYDRGYVMDQSIRATPLGMSLIETLEKYSPIIIDEELTRNFETEMEAIQESKKSNLKSAEQKIIDEAKKTITAIAKDFEKNNKKIGEELMDANIELIKQEREANKLTKCPVCGVGDLAIMYSRKTRRSFVACNKYPDCKTTYSLPPNGLIKKTDKICESCGFPMLMRLSKGKRPWIFCFNTSCETNKKRIEEYREKQESEKK